MALNRFSAAATAALVTLVAAAPALAHPGHGAEGGFAHGVFHPLTGIDHLLAMVAVGFWASQLGGKARFALPAAFVAVMIAGGLSAGLFFFGHGVEYGIALSVVALGALIAFTVRMPMVAGAVLVAGFGFLHGQAHGHEMPLGAGPLAYGAGFVLATAMLHGLGLVLGRLLEGASSARLARIGGGAVAAAGLVLLVLV